MKRLLTAALLTLSLGPAAFAQNATGGTAPAGTAPTAGTSSTAIPGSPANRDTPGADVYANKPITPPQTATAPKTTTGQPSLDCAAGNSLTGTAGTVGPRGTNCLAPKAAPQPAPAPVPGTSNPITGH